LLPCPSPAVSCLTPLPSADMVKICSPCPATQRQKAMRQRRALPRSTTLRHRACGRRMTPEETRRHEGRCPDCGKKVTVGVVHRVEELADRKKARKPKRAAGFTSLIGLPEVLGELLEVRPTTKKVEKEYTRLIAALGSELHILREAKLDSIAQEGWTRLGEAIGQMREGDVHVSAGYDGEYGTVKVFA